MQPRKFLSVIGTRPEAIKMAPIIRLLTATKGITSVVAATAQHRNLLDQTLERLGIAVNYDLDLMMDGQHPTGLLARMLPALDEILTKESPDVVIAQGDTTTVLGAALCAFHRSVPFAHVEAGLRTNDLGHPFPEEGYRQMVSRIARWHFAPTARAADALKAEGVPESRILLTGNTCIDTLVHTIGQPHSNNPPSGRTILLTTHRRENFGKPMRSIFSAVNEILRLFPDVKLAYPVHPNPNVRALASEMLGNNPQINLLPPLDYFDFVELMRQSTLILTDSGGVQEEAPALGKPVLVLRNTTERPEAVIAGAARLVGTETANIVAASRELLENSEIYAAMSKTISPYGDGRASLRIIERLASDLFINQPEN